MTAMDTAKPAAGIMLHALARNWWIILLRGICALVFGLLTFVWPGVTLVTLVLLWGAFASTEASRSGRGLSAIIPRCAGGW